MKHRTIYRNHGDEHLVWLHMSPRAKERVQQIDLERNGYNAQGLSSIYGTLDHHYVNVYLKGRYL